MRQTSCFLNTKIFNPGLGRCLLFMTISKYRGCHQAFLGFFTPIVKAAADETSEKVITEFENVNQWPLPLPPLRTTFQRQNFQQCQIILFRIPINNGRYYKHLGPEFKLNLGQKATKRDYKGEACGLRCSKAFRCLTPTDFNESCALRYL